MRRSGALGVVVSLVADVFTAIVGSILGGPTSGVHGTDGRHHVVYELVLTNELNNYFLFVPGNTVQLIISAIALCRRGRRAA